MTSTLIDKEQKTQLYESTFVQIKALLSQEDNKISNMANFVAVLKTSFDFFWVGFYLRESNHLMLGPFQGPVACTRIAKGKGVCGTSWSDQKSIIVGDVRQFPGHITCSEESNSEIVIPLIQNGEVIGVLDIDSSEFNYFDEVDKVWLEKLCSCLVSVL